MKKTTLYGDDLAGMAKAAEAGRNYQRVNGTPSLNVIGFRIDGKYYSVKFNKAGISVWENALPPPPYNAKTEKEE